MPGDRKRRQKAKLEEELTIYSFKLAQTKWLEKS